MSFSRAKPSFPQIMILLLAIAPTACSHFGSLRGHAYESNEIRSGSLHFQVRTSSSADPVKYYIRETESEAPLVLYIQGSGCSPVFVEGLPGDFASTVFSFTTMARRSDVSLMIVEKPFTPRNVPKNSGTMLGCPDNFNRNFDADTWLATLQLAIEDARRLPWVSKDRMLVVGFSEGAHMASALAAADPRITDVALIGATGTNQVFDMIAAAYNKSGNGHLNSRLAVVDEFLRTLATEPDATDKMLRGHTHRRWSSFFRLRTNENLLSSDANVLLYLGTNDESVPSISSEIIFADLSVSPGRCVTLSRFFGAGHSLQKPDEDLSVVEGRLLSIASWFLASGDEKCSQR